MATDSEQLQQIATKYMPETGITTATSREIGSWAITEREERVAASEKGDPILPEEHMCA